jgi:hypothetical protein
VIVAAIILLAFAIVAVTQCSRADNVFCLVVNILTIVGCIFGIIGAIRLHAGWLNIFCFTLVVLIVLDIIYLIIAAVNGHSAGDILWNIVVVILLFITLVFAAHLRNAVSGSTVLI